MPKDPVADAIERQTRVLQSIDRNLLRVAKALGYDVTQENQAAYIGEMGVSRAATQVSGDGVTGG